MPEASITSRDISDDQTQLVLARSFVDDGAPTALATAPEDLVGTTLNGTYLVERVLGEGGMGRVYLAQHRRIAQKRVAIKVLHSEFGGNAQIQARFQREAETAASISHPNVIAVLDVDRTPSGLPFLVCEYLDGVDLSDHLSRVGKLDVETALRIGVQLCSGLGAAHARGVIHRDLKPPNVFLTGDLASGVPARLHVMVLDFGLSRFLEPAENDQLTKTGFIMGTPSYMAPEQARGRRVDHRADVYGVGAILYTALTGRPPYEGDSPQDTVIAVMHSEPPRPRALEPSIPPELELVIERAMARDPAERYPDMAALRQALEAVQQRGALVTASEKPLPPSARRASATASGEDVHAARPRLVLYMTAAAALAVVFATSATNGLEVATGHRFSALELRLLFVGVVGSAATPLVLWIRHVRRDVWHKSSRVLALLGRVRAAVLGAVVSYALAMLALHVTDGFLLRFLAVPAAKTVGAGWSGWSLLLPGLSLASAWAAARARGIRNRRAAGWRRSVALGALLVVWLAVIGGLAHIGVGWHARSVEANAPRAAITTASGQANAADNR